MAEGGRLVIWGAGAIGGTLGAHLARGGHDVLFVDQDAAHVAAILRHGLRIAGPVAEFAVRASARLPDEVPGPLARVLLCVKAQDTGAAVRTIAPRLAPGGYVASIQNGLCELAIANAVGRARTLGGFVAFGAAREAPGVVRFLDARRYGPHPSLVVGEMDGRASPRAASLGAALRAFDPEARASDNVLGYVWSKTAFSALLFATALVDAPLVEVLASPPHRPALIALAREVLAIAAADGARPQAFNDFDPGPFLPGAGGGAAARALDETIARNRDSPKTHSGFWRDLKVLRRKTEADGLLGPVLRIGRERGVAAPLTARLLALVREIEEDTRPQAWATLDALAGAAPT